MRHTGGVAVGEISTKSRFFSRAILSASKGGRMPICWPSSSITRISRARMRSLVRIKRLSIQSSVHSAVLQGGKNYSTARRCTGDAGADGEWAVLKSVPLLVEIRESLPHGCDLLRILQFLPRPPNTAIDAHDGSRPHGSRLEFGGIGGIIGG